MSPRSGCSLPATKERRARTLRMNRPPLQPSLSYPRFNDEALEGHWHHPSRPLQCALSERQSELRDRDEDCRRIRHAAERASGLTWRWVSRARRMVAPLCGGLASRGASSQAINLNASFDQILRLNTKISFDIMISIRHLKDFIRWHSLSFVTSKTR